MYWNINNLTNARRTKKLNWFCTFCWPKNVARKQVRRMITYSLNSLKILFNRCHSLDIKLLLTVFLHFAWEQIIILTFVFVQLLLLSVTLMLLLLLLFVCLCIVSAESLKVDDKPKKRERRKRSKQRSTDVYFCSLVRSRPNQFLLPYFTDSLCVIEIKCFKTLVCPHALSNSHKHKMVHYLCFSCA